MPLKPEDKREPVKISAKIHPDLAERFSRYLIYLRSSKDYVIAGALQRAMDGDPAFRKWERDPKNSLPVATGKSDEGGEQKTDQAAAEKPGKGKQKASGNVTQIPATSEAAA